LPEELFDAFAIEPAKRKSVRTRIQSEAHPNFETTEEIPIPKNPLEQVIGQAEAVKISTIAAKQHRNLLMVGPPGTGKSLIAKSVSFLVPRPTMEVHVLDNPANPERPAVEIRKASEIEQEKKIIREMQNRFVSPEMVPGFVSERLGFRCRRCGRLSSPQKTACPSCHADKFVTADSPFNDLVSPYIDERVRQDRITTTKLNDSGREEVIVYERVGEQIRVLDQRSLMKMNELKKSAPRKPIVLLNRNNFILATGASETELLGDVRHDPYGGHQSPHNPMGSLGTPPYQRVVPGAIHEAHEGILFIDEISTLGNLQKYILTAMQEKTYPIVGRNQNSTGSSVKVEGVPTDFVLIAGSNINDLHQILPPLRSRILGNGYEVLLDTTMPDNAANRAKLAQFIAQEVRKDGKIPHADRQAVEAIIAEARRRAKTIDNADNSLTLRLRELSGIVRLAGDIARGLEAPAISKSDVELAVKRGKNIEEQLKDKYGSLYKASQGDVGRSEFEHDSKEIT
jgi:ATP-dependent Lon protease